TRSGSAGGEGVQGRSSCLRSWLVSEEPDFQYRVVAGDSEDRLLVRFFEALRLILTTAGTDLFFAPRLIATFHHLRLLDVDHLARRHVVQGGSPMSEVIWRAVEPLRSSPTRRSTAP